MSIKPIETIYDGYRFRSRLEARWAVFFDSMGIKYQYEPEGMDLGKIYYLPDFYLPDFECYVEIKAEGKIKFIDEDGDLFVEGEDTEKYLLAASKITSCKKIYAILAGDPISALGVPKLGHGDGRVFFKAFDLRSIKELESLHDIDKRNLCNVALPYGGFSKEGIVVLWTGLRVPPFFPGPDKGLRIEMPCLEEGPSSYIGIGQTVPGEAPEWDLGRLFEACEKARQARFEHGETPTV